MCYSVNNVLHLQRQKCVTTLKVCHLRGIRLNMICTIRDVDCCAHKKSFNTAIPVRNLGPYMRVHYCTDIVHILV